MNVTINDIMSRRSVKKYLGKAVAYELGVNGEYEGISFCIVGYAAPIATKPQSERKPDYVVWVK